MTSPVSSRVFGVGAAEGRQHCPGRDLCSPRRCASRCRPPISGTTSKTWAQKVGLLPTLRTSVGNPRCVAFRWALSRRARNRLQHALNGNPPLRLRLRHKQPPKPYSRQETFEPPRGRIMQSSWRRRYLTGVLAARSGRHARGDWLLVGQVFSTRSSLPSVSVEVIFEGASIAASHLWISLQRQKVRCQWSEAAACDDVSFLRGPVHRPPAREYLRRSSDLLRGSVHPAPAPKVNSIDNHLRLCLAGSGASVPLCSGASSQSCTSTGWQLVLRQAFRRAVLASIVDQRVAVAGIVERLGDGGPACGKPACASLTASCQIHVWRRRGRLVFA